MCALEIWMKLETNTYSKLSCETLHVLTIGGELNNENTWKGNVIITGTVVAGMAHEKRNQDLAVPS